MKIKLYKVHVIFHTGELHGFYIYIVKMGELDLANSLDINKWLDELVDLNDKLGVLEAAIDSLDLGLINKIELKTDMSTVRVRVDKILSERGR